MPALNNLAYASAAVVFPATYAPMPPIICKEHPRQIPIATIIESTGQNPQFDIFKRIVVSPKPTKPNGAGTKMRKNQYDIYIL